MAQRLGAQREKDCEWRLERPSRTSMSNHAGCSAASASCPVVRVRWSSAEKRRHELDQLAHPDDELNELNHENGAGLGALVADRHRAIDTTPLQSTPMLPDAALFEDRVAVARTC